MTEPPALIAAVRELTRVTEALHRTLSEDYPKRREIERDFVSRQQSTRRIIYFIIFIFGTAIISGFVTMGTVSTCFLGDAKHPDICNSLPGYESAQKQNEKIIREFYQLQKITQRNEARLDRIEGRQ